MSMSASAVDEATRRHELRADRYTYAGNDPIARWDPTGESAAESGMLNKRVGLATIRGATITGLRLACVFYEVASLLEVIEPGMKVDLVVQGTCTAVALKGRCFPAGTGVATPNGLMNIEDIEPGDLVLSREHAAGPWDRVP